jgi:outer membrane protein assembly factor BamB
MSRRVWIVAAVIVALGWLGWQFLNHREYYLYALDAESGQVLWAAALPESKLSTSRPYAAEGRVYVGLLTQDERPPAYDAEVSLVAFDASTGQRLWTYVPDRAQFGEITSRLWADNQPYVIGDLVFLILPGSGRTPYHLVALDSATGNLRWVREDAFALRGHTELPEVRSAANRLFAILASYANEQTTFSLKALDPQTGQPIQDLWTWKPQEDGFLDDFDGPLLQTDAQTVFVVTTKGIRAFDATSGQPKFRIDQPRLRYSVAGNTLYARALRSVTAYDTSNGAVRWVYEMVAPRFTYLRWIRASEQAAYLVCECPGHDGDDGTSIIALDAATGRELWTQPTSSVFGVAHFLKVEASPSTPAFVYMPTARTDSAGNELTGIVAARVNDGAPQWQFVTAPTRLKTPTTDGGRVFATTLNTRLRTFLTGIDPSWRYRVGVDES